jgi:hypothetical protein
VVAGRLGMLRTSLLSTCTSKVRRILFFADTQLEVADDARFERTSVLPGIGAAKSL